MVAFVDASGSVVIYSVADRIVVHENGTIFVGPDNSTFGVVFPEDGNEVHLEHWCFDLECAANGDATSAPAQPLTRESMLVWLAAKGIPCVEIGTASGYLFVYDLLSAVTPLPTVQ